MVDSPHAIFPGMTEKDYYVGALTNPGTSAGAERTTISAIEHAQAIQYGQEAKQ
jgi:NADH-quinone oxidoreductase subunit I